MTLGDRTWTAGGRLELQVHGGNLIRLAQSTDLAALNLTEDTKQFSLSAGVASFRIRRLGDDEVFEVDTPNAAITFERTGDYRIDVRPDGDTRVQVRRGRAIVASGGGQVPLGSGDAMLIEGYEPPRYDMIGMAAAGRLGWLGRESRRPLRQRPLLRLRLGGHRRRRGSRPVRPLAAGSELRLLLDSGHRRRRLAAVPRRPLDLAGPLGMDLGVLRALGLGAVSLRPLGHLELALVLGARRAARRGCDLQPGAGRLRRRRTGLLGLRRRRHGLHRLVPARAPRSVHSVVGASGDDGRERHQHHVRQPDLCHGRQPEHVRIEPRGQHELRPRQEHHQPRRAGAGRSRRDPDRSDARVDPRRDASSGGPAAPGGGGVASRRHADGASPGAPAVRQQGRRDSGKQGTAGDDGRSRAHLDAGRPHGRADPSGPPGGPGIGARDPRAEDRQHPGPQTRAGGPLAGKTARDQGTAGRTVAGDFGSAWPERRPAARDPAGRRSKRPGAGTARSGRATGPREGARPDAERADSARAGRKTAGQSPARTAGAGGEAIGSEQSGPA